MQNRAYASIALGIVSAALSFAPLLVLQVVGACVGVAGVVCSRRAKKADYRVDLPSTIGLVCSGAGILLCLVGPVLFVAAHVFLLFAG